ncbi:Polyprenyl synthetase [human gut metagenome]|uniref:Polyprenyl synthetase n=1 Tax=human gut metagenome TaxID=408170 RepID=K1UKU6_9ZZZZ
MGCISAGANENQMACASKFAYSLGIAFQIQDDILDIIGDEKELGKPIGSDAQNDKTTYATLLGIDKAKADVEKLTQSAISQLDAFEKTEFLKELALKLVNRKK